MPDDVSVYRIALLRVLDAVREYLPPDGISKEDALSRIISIVDPWPGDANEISRTVHRVNADGSEWAASTRPNAKAHRLP